MILVSPRWADQPKWSVRDNSMNRHRETRKLYVAVRENNVDQALRVLKKKMQREGLFREMKNRRAFEKPSERRARQAAESTRRVRKLMRKRMEREGY